MIAEETLAALEALFPKPEPTPEPEPEPAAEEISEQETAADAETGPEGEEQQAKEEEPEDAPRENGVVERDYSVHGYHIDAQVDPGQLLDAVTILDEREYFLETITGVDWINDEQYELIYDFSRYDFDLCRVVIRTRVSRQEPEVPTITEIIPGANWHERETHDFFGIKFSGHPHLIPLLLPEDADFHPLRKDFKA